MKSRNAILTAVFVFLFVMLTGMGGKPQNPPEQAAPQTGAVAEKSAAGQQEKAAAGESAVKGAPAAITAVSLRDSEILTLKKPIIVTFSDPMVKELDTPVPAADMPFSISPDVEGEGRWLTDRSFAFMAKKPYAPGRTYSLLFKDELQTLEGRPVRYYFSFKTRAPQLQRIQPEGFDLATARQVLHLDFSMPVSRAALKSHLSVTDEAANEVLPFSFGDEAGGESSSQSVIAELGSYRKQITVSLREDKDGDEHPLGLQQAYTVRLNIPDPDSGDASVRVEGTADSASTLHMYDPYCDENSSGRIYARFGFSDALATHSQKEFIEVTPDLPYTFDADGSALVIRDGLEPGMQVSVTLKAGLTDAAGRTLKEALTRSIEVKDYDPAVRFAEQGNFLTPVFGSRVALNMVNVDQVTLSLKRQYDNNLPFMGLEPDYQAVNMMRDLAFQEISIKKATSNEILRRAVDIEELAKGRRGVFQLTVRGYRAERDSRGEVSYEYTNTQERLVVLTDIGLAARSFPAGITVFASGLSTGKPLADMEIKVYSSSNQLIARGHTGPDGLFVHQRGEEWDTQLQPHIVVARYGEEGHEDMTFLPLEPDTSVELPDPASRPYLDSGYEAFVYTPRGVFRPGENVDIKALVRGPDHNPPAPFPVLFRVMSSRGLEIAKGSALLSGEGGADFSFSLPQSAPTGSYYALVEIPGQKSKQIGDVTFSVEDFVPPRLEVSVEAAGERLMAEEPLPVTLGGRYLFGAPGAGLMYELGYRVTPQAFAPEGWEGYAFGDSERSFAAQSNLKYMSGGLSEAGAAELAFKAPADWRPAALLRVLLIASVQEEGGRWVTRTGTVTYFPTPWMLGLKFKDERVLPGKKAAVEIAAVDPAGKSAELGPVSVELSLVQGNWHTIHKDGRYVYTWNERLIPQEKVIVEGAKGLAEFEFTPKSSGRYLVRAAAADGSIVASRRISVYDEGEVLSEDGSGRMDTVELRFDKKDYRPGDTARLSIKAPYTGTLLLGLERGRQLSTRVMPLDKPSAELEIPVLEGMDPNITVTAWVVRAVDGPEREWFSHRACGMTGLLISKEPNILKVSAKTPERAVPSAPLVIPFTVTDEQGTPVEGEFSVALIDEGILSLTAFRTPDPAAFFMERRRAVGFSYDAYDALLRPEAKATPLLTPGGGAAEDYQGSLSTQQVFLTAYLPVVRTDANGQGLAALDIPEYSGKGRLMIVGASQNRFASAEAPVPVARDIVAEVTAPRAVAPGDSFAVPLTLFTLARENKNAEGENLPPLPAQARVRVSATGPITLSGDLDTLVSLDGAASPAPEEKTAAPAPDGKAAAPEDTTATPAPDGKAVASEPGGKAASSAPEEKGEAAASADTAAPSAPAVETAAAPASEEKAATTAPEEKAAASAPEEKAAAAVSAPGKPGSRSLSVTATAEKAAGIAVVTVEVSVPGREDLSFSKTVEIAVRPPYPRTAALSAALIKAGTDKTMSVPGAWLPGKIRTTFLVDKSPVLAILPALDYLREYPYGCLEQTVSRAWPYLSLDSVQAVLHPDAPEGGNSKAMLADIVSRVSAMQTPSGGFGLWPGYSSADPWRSAAAAFFLVEAKSVTPVAQATLEASLAYMKLLLASPPDSFYSKQYAYTTKAFAAFVLTRAGQPPLGWLQHLTEQENEMLPSGRIFLAGAKALKAGNTKALRELESSLPALGSFSLGYNQSLESDLRNQALLLYLWAELDPSSDRAGELAVQLAQSLTAARYYTTQEAGMASMALGVYLSKTGEKGGGYIAAITPEGGPVVTVAKGGRFLSTASNAPLNEQGAVPQVKVEVSGEGQAYCLYSVRGTPMQGPEPVSEVLSVKRQWKTPAGEVIALDNGPVTVQKGDRIIVELTLTSQKALADVALSDLLPGGLEIENARLNTAAAAAEDGGEDTKGGMFIDQREDRLLVFFDYVDSPRTYTYSLRAVSTGSFVLPPVAADAMYDPACKAIGETGAVIVK